MKTWYNENDPQIVAWLRELRAEGLVPDGTIDERSIEDIGPNDCAETSHFFAGIGGWAYAFELAGWPQDAPAWTGSCPCQPFSSAGKSGGFDDPRHLWPVWKKLIKKCRPPTIFGEQVASPLGREWLARVQADLEALGYAVGRADVCAAGVGAPQIRQRIWWVAESKQVGRRRRTAGHSACEAERIQSKTKTTRSSITERMADPLPTGRPEGRPIAGNRQATRRSGDSGVGDTNRRRSPARRQASEAARHGHPAFADGSNGFWSDYDFVACFDGKARRVERSTFPLAQRIPSTVGRLRGYGNAIVPQVAAVFVRAYMEARGLV